MSIRRYLTLLLLFIVSTDLVAQAESPGAVSRVDHVLVEHKRPEEIFSLFSKQLQLPIIWPMTDYGVFSSGGLFFGNVVVEFGRFGTLATSAPESARLAGVALMPSHSASASIAILEQRQIPHGRPELFNTYRNGQAQTLWTNVRINGVAPNGTQLFVCEYYFDTKPRLQAALAELTALQGGPLGLLGVKDIVVEARNLDDARVRWKALLSPATEREPGVFLMSEGPTISVVRGETDSLRVLTLTVVSLPRAKKALSEHSIPYVDRGTEVILAEPSLQGLQMTLVQQ